jgi:hypothetical protein
MRSICADMSIPFAIAAFRRRRIVAAWAGDRA